MDIVTLNQINAGDTIEIPWGKGYAAALIEKIVHTPFAQVMLTVGQITYGWDHDDDTEVLLLSRG